MDDKEKKLVEIAEKKIELMKEYKELLEDINEINKILDQDGEG